MKIFQTLFISLTFTFFCSSQKNSGIITYGQNLNNFIIDTTSIDDSYLKSVLLKSFTDRKNALSADVDVYKLVFNKSQSRFEPIERLSSDYKNAYQRAITKGIYYIDINSNKIVYSKYSGYLGKQLIINYDKQPYAWKIHNEKKEIKGYICQKAEAIIQNEKGVKSKVIAWFTNEINLNFGPKQYFGLPGLIIELHELESVYYLRSIKFKDVELDTTKKGEEISYDDYLKMVNGVSRF
ncbi:GLPGLI family protein [Psychroflexus planctonicus]|uniref:GLPGLI family protein n=1 Tax=Psychroflexus planctonicus TaxID=1526575 RepID=A0ABQ1SL24_9FLAO|nr:GLPGLI family protein [Psychroflexus planctonicus]GGE44564.1 GLPGLI family protein [Psychroflexus planctonicus]